MRLQPPKNKQYYEDKPATKDLAIDYIGDHRVIIEGKEVLLRQYFKDIECTKKDFLSLFPYEIQNLAEIYWESKISNTRE